MVFIWGSSEYETSVVEIGIGVYTNRRSVSTSSVPEQREGFHTVLEDKLEFSLVSSLLLAGGSVTGGSGG